MYISSVVAHIVPNMMALETSVFPQLLVQKTSRPGESDWPVLEAADLYKYSKATIFGEFPSIHYDFDSLRSNRIDDRVDLEASYSPTWLPKRSCRVCVSAEDLDLSFQEPQYPSLDLTEALCRSG